MNLLFRLLYMVLHAYRRARVHPLDTTRRVMRVWPNDLDIFLHMNNGRYLTIMDLGRVDLMIRTGMVAAMRLRNWVPVVAALSVNYKRPLKLWQRFEMTTCVVGWDERSIYLQQAFHSNGKLIAAAMIKTMMRNADGAVPGAEVMTALGCTGPSPALPPAARHLAETEIAAQDTVSVRS